MKVFISWSGEVSHAVASVFAEMLPLLFEDVKPFLSSNIEKGKRWNPTLAEELRDTSYGIICLTRASLDSPWVLFEAGALSKLDASHISTFLLGLNPSDVKPPLADFQATLYKEEDVKKLIKSINNSLEHPRVDANLEGNWGLWWPGFKARVDPLEMRSNEEEPEPKHDAEKFSQETIEELLQLAREQHRILSSPENILPLGYLDAVLPYRRPVLEYRNLREATAMLSSALEELQGLPGNAEISNSARRRLFTAERRLRNTLSETKQAAIDEIFADLNAYEHPNARRIQQQANIMPPRKKETTIADAEP